MRVGSLHLRFPVQVLPRHHRNHLPLPPRLLRALQALPALAKALAHLLQARPRSPRQRHRSQAVWPLKSLLRPCSAAAHLLHRPRVALVNHPQAALVLHHRPVRAFRHRHHHWRPMRKQSLRHHLKALLCHPRAVQVLAQVCRLRSVLAHRCRLVLARRRLSVLAHRHNYLRPHTRKASLQVLLQRHRPRALLNRPRVVLARAQAHRPRSVPAHHRRPAPAHHPNYFLRHQTRKEFLRVSLLRHHPLFHPRVVQAPVPAYPRQLVQAHLHRLVLARRRRLVRVARLNCPQHRTRREF
jgi:hypothetical protein